MSNHMILFICHNNSLFYLFMIPFYSSFAISLFNIKYLIDYIMFWGIPLLSMQLQLCQNQFAWKFKLLQLIVLIE